MLILRVNTESIKAIKSVDTLLELITLRYPMILYEDQVIFSLNYNQNT